jgi:hypothetical protein
MTAPSLKVQIQGQGVVTADDLNTYQQTCDTFADLRAFIGIPGVQVISRGQSAINDGFGGVFYWNASGTGPDDNLNDIVPPGVALGCWTRLLTSNAQVGFLAIDTVAALRALPASNASAGSAVYLKGYSSGNDGGEGIFYVTNVNPGADNGGTIIWSSTAGIYYVRAQPVRDLLSLKWFGAKGDGVTNDYPAIASAVAATRASNLGQATLWLPTGRFLANQGVDFSGISVDGASAIESIIMRGPSSTDLYTVKLDDTAYGGGSSRMTYKNFQIDGNQAGNANANWCLGLLGNTLNNVFTNILLQNNRTGGLRFVKNAGNRPNANTFINLQILNGVGVGADIRAGQVIKFINLTIENIVGQFFLVSGADEAVGPLSVDGYFFENNGNVSTDAVTVTAASGVSGDIEFKNGTVQQYGLQNGSAGHGFNIVNAKRVTLGPGLNITPVAGASAAGHRKIFINSVAGAVSVQGDSFTSTGANADIEDASYGAVYINDDNSYTQLFITNTGTIVNGTTIFISPTNLLGTVTTFGNAAARWMGRGSFQIIYVESSVAPGVGKTYACTLYKNGNPFGLTATITNAAQFVTGAFAAQMFDQDSWAIQVASTAGAADILAGQLRITLGVRR